MIQNELSNSKRIFGLDVMRTLAILMVLSSHSLWIYPENNSVFSKIFHLFGFLGVEIFFVLSGFLIGKIVYDLFVNSNFGRSEITNFIKRRWFRTFPNYFLVLIIAVLIAKIIGYEIENLWHYFFFIHNFSNSLPAFFPESWSLSVEEWTYCLLPLSLLFATFFLKNNKKFCFLITIIFLLIFFFSTKIFYHFSIENSSIKDWNTDLKSVVIFRIDSILYGVLASYLFTNFSLVWRKYKMIFFVLGLIGILFFNYGISKLLNNQTVLNFYWNVLYLPLTSISIAFLLPLLSEWKTTHSWFKKPIVFISLISYSIYLLHYSVILQMMKHYIATENFTTIQLHIFTGVYLIITFALSAFLYKFYELPLMNLRDSKPNEKVN